MFTKKIKNYLKTQKNIEAALLHGSYAKGTAKPESDIDIGILLKAGQKMTDIERAQLTGELSYHLRKNVDIGIISSSNLVYAKEVLTNGIPIYIKNQNYLDLMTMTLLSMYLNFNKDRKEILNAWYT